LQIGLGEIFSLLCALTWAIAVICMRKSGEEADPLSINIFKISISSLLFLPTIWIMGEDFHQIQLNADFWLLVLSGTIGIGIADTLWLTALSRTNASSVAIMDCAYSPSVVLLSACFLGERLTVNQLIGCGLVLCSLVFVSLGRSHKKNAPVDISENIFPQMIEGNSPGLILETVSHKTHSVRPISGTVFGVSAVVLMALGVVIMKPILSRFPLFLTIEIRSVAGLTFLLVLIPFRRNQRSIVASLTAVKRKGLLILGSLLASYVAMVFWVAGTKYSTASVAAILNQTSTVFIVLLAFFLLKERLGPSKIVACVVGLAGVILILAQV
jgi:drug/metabolite transporter (DMT)-like permease